MGVKVKIDEYDSPIYLFDNTGVEVELSDDEYQQVAEGQEKFGVAQIILHRAYKKAREKAMPSG